MLSAITGYAIKLFVISLTFSLSSDVVTVVLCATPSSVGLRQPSRGHQLGDTLHPPLSQSILGSRGQNTKSPRHPSVLGP